MRTEVEETERKPVWWGRGRREVTGVVCPFMRVCGEGWREGRTVGRGCFTMLPPEVPW